MECARCLKPVGEGTYLGKPIFCHKHKGEKEPMCHVCFGDHLEKEH